MVDKHEEAQLRLCGLFRKTDNDESIDKSDKHFFMARDGVRDNLFV